MSFLCWRDIDPIFNAFSVRLHFATPTFGVYARVVVECNLTCVSLGLLALIDSTRQRLLIYAYAYAFAYCLCLCLCLMSMPWWEGLLFLFWSR